VRAICTDGRDALLAPKPEPRAMAECVAALLADDGLRRRLADAARARVTAFSWHRRARSIGEFVEAHRAR
jgi:glycosyltransferase involved in cell wall biosynthesis